MFNVLFFILFQVSSSLSYRWFIREQISFFGKQNLHVGQKKLSL